MIATKSADDNIAPGIKIMQQHSTQHHCTEGRTEKLPVTSAES